MSRRALFKSHPGGGMYPNPDIPEPPLDPPEPDDFDVSDHAEQADHEEAWL